MGLCKPAFRIQVNGSTDQRVAISHMVDLRLFLRADIMTRTSLARARAGGRPLPHENVAARCETLEFKALNKSLVLEVDPYTAHFFLTMFFVTWWIKRPSLFVSPRTDNRSLRSRIPSTCRARLSPRKHDSNISTKPSSLFFPPFFPLHSTHLFPLLLQPSPAAPPASP